MPPVNEPPFPFSKAALRGSRAFAVLWIFYVVVVTFLSRNSASAQDGFPKSPEAAILPPGNSGASRSSYVGDEACIACHPNQVDSYHHTAHARTSSISSPDTVHGHFESGTNILRTANENLYFKMEANEKGLFQTAVMRTSATEVLTRTERIDIVVGSGRKGQTYLFWDGDALFQLPVSYWTEINAWVNSPGYVDGAAVFERPISSRCLECHATSFESKGPPDNIFNRSKLTLGISCEKCHGPGSEHIAMRRGSVPGKPHGYDRMVNPAKLSRERQIDICMLCHAGIGNSLTPPLSFVPGNTLAEHLVFPQTDLNAPIDVHASQVQLMERSRCFKSSSTLTCTTCHDVHTTQRDLGAMAQACLTCHAVENCGVFPKLGHSIDRQCIRCHMPLQETAQIISSVDGRKLQPKVRNHRIAIYPDNNAP